MLPYSTTNILIARVKEEIGAGLYVFGSLEYLHGAPPSERTFLGVIPMITSTNILLRLINAISLKRRLRQYITDEDDHAPAAPPSDREHAMSAA